MSQSAGAFSINRDLTRSIVAQGGGVVTDMEPDGSTIRPPPPLQPRPGWGQRQAATESAFMDISNVDTPRRRPREAPYMEGSMDSQHGDGVYADAYGYSGNEFQGPPARSAAKRTHCDHAMSDCDDSADETESYFSDEDMVVDPVGEGLNSLDEGLLEVEQGMNALAVAHVMTPQTMGPPPPPFKLGSTMAAADRPPPLPAS